MRDDALAGLRSSASNPLKYGGLGRPADSAPGDDDVFLDPIIDAELTKALAPLQAELDAIRDVLDQVVDPLDLSSAAGLQWKELTERMQRKALQLYSKKLQLQQDLLSRVEVFVMTIDCFNQIAAGQSSMSKFFERLSFKVCIIDEGHQAELEPVAAVCTRVDNLVMFFDGGQEIRPIYGGQESRKTVSLPGATCYNWAHACNGDFVRRPWSMALPDSVSRLVVAKAML